MHRRDLLRASAALPLLVAAGPAPMPTPPAPPDTPFDGATVRTLARQLALQPYKAPDSTLPDALKNLDYSAYRSINFDPGQALWRGQAGMKFTAAFFHRGYLYKERVDIYEVAGGRATPVRYASSMFTFDKVSAPTGDLGFAGFRLHYPLNRNDYFDEVCAFLGASYFRAIAKGQGYGMSARGLAINTADPKGEEFPLFKAFWLERPTADSDVMVVHALLDSASTTAAYRFTIRPGEETVFDTESAIFPRTDLTQPGLAPMTSMYLFDANDRRGFDDWRAAVHDSTGLELRTGRDEHIWRPLTNPRDLQISAFADISPRAFGLMQRARAFTDYQDLEARYEKRPSLWVEPIGDWGEGVTELVEIPSDEEVNDNMVGFWRPKDPLKAKGEYLLNYRLHWCWAAPGEVRLGQVMQTRCGVSANGKNRQFVIDFVGPALKAWKGDAPPALDVGCDKGKIVNAVTEPNPDITGWRISIEHDPQGNKVVELHARLMDGDKPLTETWVYRWTPV
ncbi:MAG: glucan biosynthesis protein G [Acetobacteraceae bacterium]|nr:glucan biosynthesis protein G [Acetobacteraceae bacterium]